MAAVSSYGTLAQAVAVYAARSDLGVSGGNLDWFVSEAEQEMNARLRVRRMLTAVTPTVSSAGVVTLPTTFGGWKRFTVRDGSNEWDLELASAEQKPEVFSLYGGTGVPRALVTEGATSQIWPYTDLIYTFAGLYYSRIPALTSSASTNWVVTNFPNAYLYGCLAAACRYAIGSANPEQAAKLDAQERKWMVQFDRVIEQIRREDAKDLDARTHATMEMNTTLFGGGPKSNIESDV